MACSGAFFFEEKAIIEEAFGENTLPLLFHNLYGQEEFKPYLLAGESYFQGAFYDKALQAFTKALEKKPGDATLQFKVYLCQGMNHFYSFAPHAALKCFEKCLSLAEKVNFLETYRTMIKKACVKIQEEFPGRRKNDQHRHLAKLAQELIKKLDMIPEASSGTL